MDVNDIPEIEMESLTLVDYGLSDAMVRFMIECAAHCFLSQAHEPNVKMRVLVDIDEKSEMHFFIKWIQRQIRFGKYSMNDDKRTTDFGANCIGLLLTHFFTKYRYSIPSAQGTGFDYWLYEEEPDEFDVLKAKARLEISGIRHANRSNSMNARLKDKEEQVTQSSYLGLPIYITIIEFNKPESIFQCR